MTGHRTTNPIPPNTRRLLRRLARRAILFATVASLVAASLLAQRVQDQFARDVAEKPAHQRACAVACSPTSRPPHHLAGGWPDPYLPALLVVTSVLGFFALTRITPAGSQSQSIPTEQYETSGPRRLRLPWIMPALRHHRP
jgi:hypothetical protein